MLLVYFILLLSYHRDVIVTFTPTPAILIVFIVLVLFIVVVMVCILSVFLDFLFSSYCCIACDVCDSIDDPDHCRCCHAIVIQGPSSLATTALEALGELSTVASDLIVPYMDNLIPFIITSMQDSTSVCRREVTTPRPPSLRR